MKMGKLLIVLFTPPWQSENTDTVYEFAKAALEEGHEVTIFCDIDATYNLMASQTLTDQTTPVGKIAKLIEMGARVLACQESARLRGIDLEKGLIKGAVKSSLGQLAVELAEKHDRIVAFG
jgi:sulfur relay (sulfurtransferase) complex TusBCD TusD component (DsrE family)